jgi:secreted Zn-dependent insulinase-like peptidase
VCPARELETLEELQRLVESKFSAIKNTKKERPSFPGQPCQLEHLQVCSSIAIHPDVMQDQ